MHFLLNVLSSPEDLFSHIKKEAGAVILKITYGYTANPHGKDPLVDMAVKTMHEFADATVPGKWAVDIMPFRKYIYPMEQRTRGRNVYVANPTFRDNSAVRTRLAPRHQLQSHSAPNGGPIAPNNRATLPVR